MILKKSCSLASTICVYSEPSTGATFPKSPLGYVATKVKLTKSGLLCCGLNMYLLPIVNVAHLHSVNAEYIWLRACIVSLVVSVFTDTQMEKGIGR